MKPWVAALIGIAVGGCASTAQLDGRWVLAESPQPETVSIAIRGDTIAFSHQCMSLAGTFHLERERLLVAPEIVTEGRCRRVRE